MLTKTTIFITLRNDHADVTLPLELVDAPPDPYAILSYDSDGESAWVLKLDRAKIEDIKTQNQNAEKRYGVVLRSTDAVNVKLPLVE